MSSSDSSMDDCNLAGPGVQLGHSSVQIPLWTIVTLLKELRGVTDQCSDSSMDDCNLIRLGKKHTRLFVQIPLWTIVTGWKDEHNTQAGGFRFLYGRL